MSSQYASHYYDLRNEKFGISKPVAVAAPPVAPAGPETPLFVKVPGGLMNALLPAGNGISEFPVTYFSWKGWATRFFVNRSDGQTMCSFEVDSRSPHGNPYNGLMVQPQPIPAGGSMYAVYCQFKRSNVDDPNLPWENASVGVRGPSFNFAWWFPEYADTPEPQDPKSPNGWSTILHLGIG